MKGLISLTANYSYEGDIVDNEPHGYGIFLYANGDKYIGKCKYGKQDGYGKYLYKSGASYVGFFSYGKIHGIGTFEDKKNIYKGSWRNNIKHGMFYRTRKQDLTTYLQKWTRGKLIGSKRTQYINPELLTTTKKNPRYIQKKHRIQYKGKGLTCITCCDKFVNATNDLCGHVTICAECWSKCDCCPICRSPIGKIITLYIS